MSRFDATRLVANDVEWPSPVAIAAERVLAGAPAASTFVLEDSPRAQFGLWRVTAGEFVTEHAGYTEFIQVLDGQGELIDDDGRILELRPGTTVLMQPGWKGRWKVRDTITKVYTILNS